MQNSLNVHVNLQVDLAYGIMLCCQGALDGEDIFQGDTGVPFGGLHRGIAQSRGKPQTASFP